jgi:hypothetical protein
MAEQQHQASRYLMKHFGLPAQNELTNATTDSFCPSRPASAATPHNLAACCPLRYITVTSNGSMAMIAAAASSPAFTSTLNYKSADGIAYCGLTALASLSMAVSVFSLIFSVCSVALHFLTPIRHTRFGEGGHVIVQGAGEAQ